MIDPDFTGPILCFPLSLSSLNANFRHGLLRACFRPCFRDARFYLAMLKKVMELGINQGRRDFTPQIAELAKCSSNFSGLPEAVDRFEILKYLKIAGPDFGFKARHIDFLAYLLGFTSELDWGEDAFHPPVVWQSLSNTAQDFSTSERQVRRWENELHNLGALTWRDSGNHKRFGVRNERGEIKYGYGVDLSPLGRMFGEIKSRAESILEDRILWKEGKRELSAQKRRVRVKMCAAELCITEIEELSKVTALTTLAEIREQQEKLSLLEIAVDSFLESDAAHGFCGKGAKMSPWADKNVPHIYTTTKLNSSKEDTCNPWGEKIQRDGTSQDAGLKLANARTSKGSPKKPAVKSRPSQDKNDPESGKTSTGIEHLNIKRLLNAATDEFRDHIPIHDRAITPADLVDAAHIMCHQLGINRHAWVEAICEMGRLPAAVCVIIADKNQYHPDNPVRNPGGFLRGMVDAAKNGELQLHKSIFGILERQKFDA